MLDAEFKMATCRIECEEKDTGTAWLVAPDKVFTARHCVLDAFDENDCVDETASITVTFIFSNTPQEVSAKIIDYDIDLDICLLSIEKPSEITPIILSDSPPISGVSFYSYGCPVSKLTLGHRLQGAISQVLDTPKLGMDVEIHIDASAALTHYRGFSGAALISDGSCLGIIRVSVDNTIGVISIARLGDFLRKHKILAQYAEAEDTIIEGLASRDDFTHKFDTFVSAQSGGYIFIEGAHGIGKSTFCETYTPVDSSLEHFDTYSFTPRKNDANAVQLAQPQEFFNWLNMQVSMFITRMPGRIDNNKDYSSLIRESGELLLRLGEEFSSRGKTGLLFIDGIDEIAKYDEKMLSQFIGLFPQQLTPGLVIVFSAPSYAKLAVTLGIRLRHDSCLSMPLLAYNVTRDFCKRILVDDRSNPVTIKLICDRAQGHPLYLRYLIDLVNSGEEDDSLAALPLIDGSIRNYYETLWNQLRGDMEAVNLLAIAVRLRWGISIDQFTEILNSAEKTVLISTIERIKHLLLTPNETTIYHSSFSDFLIEKTQLRERDIQSRLAEYCEQNRSNRYGLLNIIHHGLKVPDVDKTHVVSLCDQSWIDECVIEGIKPDTLLGDVYDILAAATGVGSLVETVRILLLSQRLQFRYNTLFAQSADLTANALLSLGMTNEVLQHVIRYGQLIIPIAEAIKVALKLIEASNNKDALELLNIVETSLAEDLELASNKNGISFRDFLRLYDLQLQQYFLKDRAGDKSAGLELQNFQFFWMKVIGSCSGDEASAKLIRSEMMMYTQAAAMCLSGRYISITQIRQHYSGSASELVWPLCYTISYYRDHCEYFGVPYDESLLSYVFSDLKTLVSEGLEESKKLNVSTIDSLISLGTPSLIIRVISGEASEGAHFIRFIADDNVSIDESNLYEGMAQLRHKSYLDPTFSCPTLLPLSTSGWIDGLSSICMIAAWCDGSARRLKEKGDVTSLETVWTVLQQNVFDQLKFSLAQRVGWKDAYALPEAVFPHIYQYLTILISDVFPERLCELLSFIERQFAFQCGLYSEGFRDVLAKVLGHMTSKPLDVEAEDQAFLLTERWKEFVVNNLKNRHELVPELLTIIPILVCLNAPEEGEKTYQSVLAFSMGPSWYKEDQFGLNVTALESLSDDLPLGAEVLPKITGLLDAAGGEMTFQRFVRYAKRDLIGVLCERGDFVNSVDYFIRQTYGTLEQLYKEATQGDIDRVSELRGTRFPGAALDEQDSILQIIKSAIPIADWQLCWTILESYQFGDSRHLDNYAEAYALLISKAEAESDCGAVAVMMDRLELICESELERTERSNFLSFLVLYLSDELKGEFETRFATHLNLSKNSEDKVQNITPNSLEAGSISDEDNEFLLPGISGTEAARQEAKKALSEAERHLRRRNNSGAQKEILAGLDILQRGGWPLWRGQVEEISKGQSLLLKTTHSVQDIIKLYSPLILSERYANSWHIANNLVEWLAGSSCSDEQSALLKLSIEHTEILVGTAQEDIDSYQFFEEKKESNVSSSLVKLILHAIDHPTWLRSEKTADMLLWLLTYNPQYIPLFAPQAFSMNSGNHPDVLCGVFEQLSHSSPQPFWKQLTLALDFDLIKQDCKHVGRLSVLMSIAHRASQNGIDSASKVLSMLKEDLGGITELSSDSEVECPLWAESMASQWFKLKTLGVINSDFIERATSVMKECCLPLSLGTALEIEQLLAEGHYGSINQLGRWSAKVRFAFQVALHSVVSESLFSKVEEIFRVYNPSRLDQLRITNFLSPALSWLKTGNPEPIHGNNIYLDYYERVWFEGGLKLVRLTAYIFDGKRNIPLPPGRFLTTEKPTLNGISFWDVCANVKGEPVYFGSFTPAIPTSTLMRLTGVTNQHLNRAYWRSGRVTEYHEGAPEHEGCYLSIDANALKLPNGFKLAWVYEVNLEPIKLITTE